MARNGVVAMRVNRARVSASWRGQSLFTGDETGAQTGWSS
jgi:hypothetical protein